ncbi:MAG: sodium:solute symporter family protein, partial [Clostridia bacterium]|nr:sodium:solute symporter family protein [Clostridia bacterium]
MDMPLTIIATVIYLFILASLSIYAYRGTKNTQDYMLAGRQIHPMVMALSYGATFISTSAIVGFGGNAGLFGMSLLWLTFLNIFVGVFIAFLVFGKRTRQMGHNLDAHTFPELLGVRFKSRFIQGFSATVILVFMPLYAAAVLKGGVGYLATQFNIDFNVTLFFFTMIIALYVAMGGMKGVMYTDAFQGSIMFGGMLFLLIFVYSKLG